MGNWLSYYTRSEERKELIQLLKNLDILYRQLEDLELYTLELELQVTGLQTQLDRIKKYGGK
jgi:hypothetical protein